MMTLTQNDAAILFLGLQLITAGLGVALGFPGLMIGLGITLVAFALAPKVHIGPPPSSKEPTP